VDYSNSLPVAELDAVFWGPGLAIIVKLLLFPSSRGGVAAHQENSAKQPLRRRRGGQKDF